MKGARSGRPAKAAPKREVRTAPSSAPKPSMDDRVAAVLTELAALSTPKDLANLTRFGIRAKGALGVAMNRIHAVAKRLGKDHDLAAALWKTDCYEARLLTSFIDDPGLVTPAQMESWCRDFDNWGICDTLCFHLFDRTRHARAKVKPWCAKKGEYQRRAGFALLACLAGHDSDAPDAFFSDGLALIEKFADDERNFVKKASNWALRRIGLRNAVLCREATEVAKRLAASASPSARWNGKDALRQFAKASARRSAAK